MKGKVISTLNNKLIFRTKYGSKITWTFIPHIKVGEEVFFFTDHKGKVTSVEPVRCRHHEKNPSELPEEEAHDIDYSELYHEHD